MCTCAAATPALTFFSLYIHYGSGSELSSRVHSRIRPPPGYLPGQHCDQTPSGTIQYYHYCFPASVPGAQQRRGTRTVNVCIAKCHGSTRAPWHAQHEKKSTRTSIVRRPACRASHERDGSARLQCLLRRTRRGARVNGSRRAKWAPVPNECTQARHWRRRTDATD